MARSKSPSRSSVAPAMAASLSPAPEPVKASDPEDVETMPPPEDLVVRAGALVGATIDEVLLAPPLVVVLDGVVVVAAVVVEVVEDVVEEEVEVSAAAPAMTGSTGKPVGADVVIPVGTESSA